MQGLRNEQVTILVGTQHIQFCIYTMTSTQTAFSIKYLYGIEEYEGQYVTNQNLRPLRIGS